MTMFPSPHAKQVPVIKSLSTADHSSAKKTATVYALQNLQAVLIGWDTICFAAEAILTTGLCKKTD